MTPQEFGTNLKKLVKKSGLTNNDLLDQLPRASYDTLMKWFRGDAMPPFKDHQLIIDVLKCSRAEFYMTEGGGEDMQDQIKDLRFRIQRIESGFDGLRSKLEELQKISAIVDELKKVLASHQHSQNGKIMVGTG